MVKITIDKEYFLPDVSEMSVAEYIELAKVMQNESATDVDIVHALIGCDKVILESLEYSEFYKLVVLAKNFLDKPTIVEDFYIPFLPLGSYPFGVYADFKKLIEKFKGGAEMIPYTIALLRPGVGYANRMGYWLEWAKGLPATIGIYYHNKMMLEYSQLCEQFKALEGDEPDDNELKAGIEHLYKYGEYITMVNLTRGDILKLESVSSLPTNLVLTYLCASKDVKTYESELNKLRKPQ